MVTEICFKDAIDLARMIRTRKVTAAEMMAAFLTQIERVNPKVNAICTLVPEEALRAAEEADKCIARRGATGPMHGLPIAVKDLALTKSRPWIKVEQMWLEVLNLQFAILH